MHAFCKKQSKSPLEIIKWSSTDEEESRNIDNLAISMDKVTNAMSSAKENINVLNSAMQEFNDSGSLSNDSIKSLIEKFPELTDKVTEHNGVLSLEKDGEYSIFSCCCGIPECIQLVNLILRELKKYG